MNVEIVLNNKVNKIHIEFKVFYAKPGQLWLKQYRDSDNT